MQLIIDRTRIWTLAVWHVGAPLTLSVQSGDAPRWNTGVAISWPYSLGWVTGFPSLSVLIFKRVRWGVRHHLIPAHTAEANVLGLGQNLISICIGNSKASPSSDVLQSYNSTSSILLWPPHLDAQSFMGLICLFHEAKVTPASLGERSLSSCRSLLPPS